MKKISLSFAAGLVFLLVGCAQPGKQAPMEDRNSVPPQTTAMLSRSLSDSDEWLMQEAAALDATNRIAWDTVQKQKITVYAKCRIIPSALKQSLFFPRFGGLMTDQYRGKCLEVVDFFKAAQAEKKAKDKKIKK